MQHGEQATQSLMAQPDPPTAIVVGSNQILVGVLRELRRSGLRIPDDVSLVTCDEVPLAEFLVPPLATIERDHFEIGAIAATLLLDLRERNLAIKECRLSINQRPVLVPHRSDNSHID